MPSITALDTVPGVNLAALDLNQLVALNALLEQRSVTRAADKLGLSQPALSASLARLRRHFHDDLLTRRGNEYRLTPLAVQLAPRTREAMGSVERVFATEPSFDPAVSQREFTVALSDYAATIFGPELARLLAEEAPNTRLRLIGNAPDITDRAVQYLLGHDLIVMPHGFLADLSHHDLYLDEWCCLVAADNDEVGDALTVDHLRTLPWVMTFFGPTASTPAARQLQLLGIQPQVQVVTENFLTVPHLVAGSRRIALLQRRLVDRLAQDQGVRALQCPLDVAQLVEAMWWHPVYDDDPEHEYLRATVLRATAAARDRGLS